MGKWRRQEEDGRSVVIHNLHGARARVKLYVLGEIRPRKTIPEAVLAHVVMIARHQVPRDLGKLTHPLHRLREGLWGELLLVVNVARRSGSIACSIPSYLVALGWAGEQAHRYAMGAAYQVIQH